MAIVLQESDAITRRFEIAKEAMERANAALSTKAKMMKWLDAGTTHLDLLMNMGSSTSEVSDPHSHQLRPFTGLEAQ